MINSKWYYGAKISIGSIPVKIRINYVDNFEEELSIYSSFKLINSDITLAIGRNIGSKIILHGGILYSYSFDNYSFTKEYCKYCGTSNEIRNSSTVKNSEANFDLYNKHNLGLVVGTKLILKPITVDIQYNQGLTDFTNFVNNITAKDDNNYLSYVTVGIGYPIKWRVQILK